MAARERVPDGVLALEQDLGMLSNVLALALAIRAASKLVLALGLVNGMPALALAQGAGLID